MKKLIPILIVLLCFTNPVCADVIFTDLFNSETPSWGDSGEVWSTSGSEDMERDTAHAKEGASSVKVYLNYDTSSTVYRSELVLSHPTYPPAPQNGNFTLGETYWFAFSIYMDSTTYTTHIGEDVIWQYHGVPDDGESTSRNPMISFVLKNDAYELHITGDSAELTDNDNKDRTVNYSTELGNVVEDEWTDFVFMITWDYTDTTVGRMDVWKDGVLLIEDEGANCYNDDLGPYLKFGCYHWWWASNEPEGSRVRTWYIDRILIGDENADYDEMAADEDESTSVAVGGSKRISVGGDKTVIFD